MEVFFISQLVSNLKALAKQAQKKIVLAEGTEIRTLEAATIISRENIAQITLLGSAEKIAALAQEKNLELGSIEIIDPETHPQLEQYAESFYQLRKSKGLSLESARTKIKDPLYLAAMLVHLDYADGYVAGAANTTGDVLRPALQIIKSEPGVSIISGAMLMILPTNQFGHNGVLVLADCGVNPAPTPEQLAEIAYCTACTAKSLVGLDPKIAMLSFSTKGSAQHEMTYHVQEATDICQRKYPHLLVDGELQLDAAIIPEVAKTKAPNSLVAGQANILIFPDLQSGNIGYKIMERLGKAQAIGPILQGMAKPVNDLSRGCSVDDIVTVTAITALQAKSCGAIKLSNT